MRELNDITFYEGRKEELVQGMQPDFPHVAGRVPFDSRVRSFAPWHWHKEIEFFYVEEGVLEYHTPNGHWIFPQGSGGMVNSNILHMTKLPEKQQQNIHMVHLFDSSLIAGIPGSRIERKYVRPILQAHKLELVPLYPEQTGQEGILDCMAQSFHLSETESGYEIRLRNLLSHIWMEIFSLSQPLPERTDAEDRKNERIKSMMVYVHEHYTEKIPISAVASAGYCSERACYRLFRECLHMTPVEYITGYRLQMARRMLEQGTESVTFISQACCLGSSSYFSRLFRESMGCSPVEYRKKWQDHAI